MDESKRQVVCSWLVKAQRDLESARRLAVGEDPLYDTAIYHCQQAGEKSLKAFLVYHDKRLIKTHNLDLLVTESAVFADEYTKHYDAALRLTQHATLFRYPGDQLEPTQAEYNQAFQDAGEFMRLTLALLPPETHP